MTTSKPSQPVAPEVNGYGEEIVSALGVMVVRASHHELALRSLMGAVADFDAPKAWALFHVTSSAKARLDIIYTLANAARLSAGVIAAVHGVLEKAKRLSDERNVFVHWEYSIQPHPTHKHAPRPILIGNSPRSKKGWSQRPFTAEDVWRVVDLYSEVSNDIAKVCDLVRSENEAWN